MKMLKSVVTPPVPVPSHTVVQNWRLGLIFRLLQVGAVALAVYLFVIGKSWNREYVPDIVAYMTPRVDFHDPEHTKFVNEFIESPTCQNPDQFSYYSHGQSHEPGFVHIRCVTLPEVESAGMDGDSAYFPIFLYERDGKTAEGDADCEAMNRTCGANNSHPGHHYYFVDYPKTADGHHNCGCISKSNYFVAGADSGKLVLGWEYQVPFQNNDGSNFLHGGTSTGREVVNGDEKGQIHVWVVYHISHHHADLSESSRSSKNVYRKFKPGEEVEMSVWEWLEASGTARLDDLNDHVGKNKLQDLMAKGAYPTCEESFNELDAAGDVNGNLSLDEFAHFITQGSTSHELAEQAKKEFNVLDENGNGELSQAEFDHACQPKEYPINRLVGVQLGITINCMSHMYHGQSEGIGEGDTICYVEVLPAHGWNHRTSITHGEPLLAGENVGTYRLRKEAVVSFKMHHARGKFGEFDPYSCLMNLSILSIYLGIPAVIISLLATNFIGLTGKLWKTQLKRQSAPHDHMVAYARQLVNTTAVLEHGGDSVTRDILDIRLRKALAGTSPKLEDADYKFLVDMLLPENRAEWLVASANDASAYTADDLAVFVKARTALGLSHNTGEANLSVLWKERAIAKEVGKQATCKQAQDEKAEKTEKKGNEAVCV